MRDLSKLDWKDLFEAIASPEKARGATESDDVDRRWHSGWSVVVSGPVEEVDRDILALVRPQLGPWPALDTDRFLLIRSERVTGQRIVTGAGSPSVDGATASIAEPSGRATNGGDSGRFTRRAISRSIIPAGVSFPSRPSASASVLGTSIARRSACF